MKPVIDRLSETCFYVSHHKIAIDTPEGLADIREWILRTEARLIIVDPLHAAHSGRSLNDGWSARRTLAPFKQFCFQNQVTGILLHHIGRGKNRVAESAQLAACAGMSLLYTRQKMPGAGRIIRLEGAGRGQFANRTWFFGSNGPLTYWPVGDPVVPPSRAEARFSLDDLVFEYLTNSEQPSPAAGIAIALKRNANSIRNALARLLSEDRIRQTYTLNRTRYYDIFRDVPHAAQILQKL